MNGGPIDRDLDALIGAQIASELRPGVSYRIEQGLGQGGFSTACLALRRSSEGLTPVVLKVMRSRVVLDASAVALRAVKKEAVALGRLNERVPPSPFVVRLLDIGTIPIVEEGKPLALPWIALEYVHGGVEGTTLRERVNYALHCTGTAFDPGRAANALEHLAEGLREIHAVEVVHRDLKPSNVLCCGFGSSELFKISDFGIARPVGLESTFGDIALGTPGYVAPEQMHLRHEIGPWSDVFSLACLVYFLLTGERYFPVPSATEAMLAAASPARRSLIEAAGLSPELRSRPDAVGAIDHALARATTTDPRQRVQTAPLFAASVLPWLCDGPRSSRPSERLVESVLGAQPTALTSNVTFGVHKPSEDLVIHDVAWDGDGHCLAVTSRGLVFWNGTGFLPITRADLGDAQFVCRHRAGSFVIGAPDGTFVEYAAGSVKRRVRAPHAARFSAFDGDFDDLGVAVGETALGLALHSRCGGRWLRPLPLPEAASIASLRRLDDTRWLIVGRARDGRGLALLYSPLDWSFERLAVPATRALVAAAALPERGVGLACGSDGLLLRVERDGIGQESLAGAPQLSAVGMDVLDRGWVGAAGRLWVSQPGRKDWSLVFSDDAWKTPFVSLFVDAGYVIALTADGAVLECRSADEADTAVVA